MPLCSMKTLLSKAVKDNYAVGAFSVINMETVLATVKAAEQMRSPAILQIGEPRLKHAPLKYMGVLMVTAAQNSSVPIAVHMDHAENMETIKAAIDLGFTSVMLDASHLPYDENLRLTREACLFAHSKNVDCEGEIGRLGLTEDGTIDYGALHTTPSEAKAFAMETDVDALAIAIGNKHGLHTSPTALNFNRLKEIFDIVDVPLVLHGGSGISDDDFISCVKFGMRKINIATATVYNIMLSAAKYFSKNATNISGGSYYEYQDMVVESACDVIKHHMKIFGSANKA